ncbi:universal stress protein [Alkalimarinus coralli]|uniref:universal stress protein n=1 Tax=Alkalimarinus coralli TaxID=2935863 RepID=UPI00202B5D38|nr:universal stress protein [Alkalimarinus coralli]
MGVSKILVVIDPKRDNRILLERSRRLAIIYDASVELYIAAYSSAIEGSHWFDKEGLNSAHAGYIHAKQAWLANLVESLEAEGVKATGYVEWAKPLHRAVLERADCTDTSLILKQADHHSVMVKALFTNTDWHLIRESKTPLLFVHENEWGSHLSVAAAVDPLHIHSKPEDLDDKLLQSAHDLACKLPAELHVVHVYEPIPTGAIAEFDAVIADYEFYREKVRSRHRESLDELLKRNVESTTIVHFEEGIPERVLPHVVNESGIDIIVMGAVSRSGLDKIFIGSTAERVLDNLMCDILILK